VTSERWVHLHPHHEIYPTNLKYNINKCEKAESLLPRIPSSINAKKMKSLTLHTRGLSRAISLFLSQQDAKSDL